MAESRLAGMGIRKWRMAGDSTNERARPNISRLLQGGGRRKNNIHNQQPTGRVSRDPIYIQERHVNKPVWAQCFQSRHLFSLTRHCTQPTDQQAEQAEQAQRTTARPTSARSWICLHCSSNRGDLSLKKDLTNLKRPVSQTLLLYVTFCI